MELSKLNTKLSPGNTFIIKEGEYNKSKINIKSSGTAESPITILSEDNVIITGKTVIRITGSHIIFTGFTFRDIDINKSIKLEGDHIQFTRNTIDHVKKDVEFVIGVYGSHCRIDNNIFKNFDKLGVIICLFPKIMTPLYCLIDKNSFVERKKMKKKTDTEMIRIGDSKTSLFDCKSFVYSNTFNLCSGGIEIISVKSCKNVIYNNKFIHCGGGVCFRHGKDNLAMYNYFLGSNEECSGIRVTDSGHRLFYNTFEKIQNENTFRSALSIMNGEIDNKLNGYAPVSNIVVKYNDFIDCENCMSIGVINKRRSNIKPTNIDVSENRFIKCRGMFNNDKNKGAAKSTITDNKIIKYDQKLNIELPYEYENVDIKLFYENSYTRDFANKNIMTKIKEIYDEKIEVKRDFLEIANRRTIKIPENKEEIVMGDLVITDDDYEKEEKKISFTKNKMSAMKRLLLDLYESNKKRNESLKRLIDIL